MDSQLHSKSPFSSYPEHTHSVFITEVFSQLWLSVFVQGGPVELSPWQHASIIIQSLMMTSRKMVTTVGLADSPKVTVP